MTDLPATPQSALDDPTTHQQTGACTAERLEPGQLLFDFQSDVLNNLDAFGDARQQERGVGAFQHHFKVRAALLRHQSPLIARRTMMERRCSRAQPTYLEMQMAAHEGDDKHASDYRDVRRTTYTSSNCEWRTPRDVQ